MVEVLLLGSDEDLSARVRASLQRFQIGLDARKSIPTFLEALCREHPDAVVLDFTRASEKTEAFFDCLIQLKTQQPMLPALCLMAAETDHHLKALKGKEWYYSLLDKLDASFFLGQTLDLLWCGRKPEKYFENEFAYRLTRLLMNANSTSRTFGKGVGKSDKIALWRSRFMTHLVPEIHSPENGRIDAKKVASMLAIPLSQVASILNAKLATVHKTATAPALQPKLSELERIITGILQLTGNTENLRAWFNAPNPDLDGKTPISLIQEGHTQTVLNLVEDALLGHPG